MENLSLKNIDKHERMLYAVGHLIVFLVIFLTAQFGRYIYFEWGTSPAILWPPTGIGVAILWLYGYRYAISIFLGLFVSAIMGPSAQSFPAVLIVPLGQFLGQLLGLFLLKRFKFEGEFSNIRAVLAFFGGIILLSFFSPLVTTTAAYFSGNLISAYLETFSSVWAGHAFSCLILTPFIIAWSLPDSFVGKNNLTETLCAGALLTIATYFLFWTSLPAEYGFIMFALFLLSVVWVCLRFSSRIVTLSVLYITVVGMAGLFVSPTSDQQVSSVVFAAELFLFLVVPIMYAYSALVKERQKNLEELKQALVRIEIENTNKTNFIAILAHELRNPLSPIKSTLEILKLQKYEPEMHKLIVNAHNQVHTMRRLLDDLLDVTRVTQGKFELKTKLLPILPLVQNAIEATRNIVSEFGHTLTFDPSAAEAVSVHVDPVRFEQVLVNIINNAAKFTPAGGIIQVSYTVSGERVTLKITDSGRGIAVDDLERIFDSFWQIRDPALSTNAGIGVGLALARQIIELHHGSIWAESMGKGKGSTFVIELPCIKGVQVALDTTHEETVDIAGAKMLVVDDNRPAADALATLLELRGHTVAVAYTGEEAINRVTENVPDFVLLDIGLPDQSGHEVAKILREKGFAGRLIALSGYGQEEDKQRAAASGFDTHFTKPMSMNTLEAYLQTLARKDDRGPTDVDTKKRT